MALWRLTLHKNSGKHFFRLYDSLRANRMIKVCSSRLVVLFQYASLRRGLPSSNLYLKLWYLIKQN